MTPSQHTSCGQVLAAGDRPVSVKVGFDPKALALEGGHIIGFSCMLLMLVPPKVHLPPQLLHPNVCLPPI